MADPVRGLAVRLARQQRGGGLAVAPLRGEAQGGPAAGAPLGGRIPGENGGLRRGNIRGAYIYGNRWERCRVRI